MFRCPRNVPWYDKLQTEEWAEFTEYFIITKARKRVKHSCVYTSLHCHFVARGTVRSFGLLLLSSIIRSVNCLESSIDDCSVAECVNNSALCKVSDYPREHEYYLDLSGKHCTNHVVERSREVSVETSLSRVHYLVNKLQLFPL